MNKIIVRYIGEDDYVVGLKHEQLLEVTAFESDSTPHYSWINKYNEEIYLYPNEVVPYE